MQSFMRANSKTARANTVVEQGWKTATHLMIIQNHAAPSMLTPPFCCAHNSIKQTERKAGNVPAWCFGREGGLGSLR
jgi:hypothetical protein